MEAKKSLLTIKKQLPDEDICIDHLYINNWDIFFDSAIVLKPNCSLLIENNAEEIKLYLIYEDTNTLETTEK